MTTGGFAAAAGLTPKALRLYDELGLLRPAAVDASSGYRSYDRDQLGRARRIAALRRVGMPLARIGVLADLPDDEAAADLTAWWRQVEHDTARRRELVADLLSHRREDRTMGTTTRGVRLRCASGSERGGRTEQQDTVGCGADRAVVADGFGDHGAAASREVVRAVLAAAGDDPAEGLRAAFATAAGTGPGTTASALWCDGSRVTIAHVGDSRVYLLREGVFTQLTLDHSHVRSLVEEGRLTPEEAREHPDRPRLVRALGTDEPDVHRRTARPGDRYLLVTDGVWAVLDDPVPARLAAGPGAPAEIVGNVLERVRAAGAPDNAACAVVDLTG
ncbi:MerR family transcriptional regulator [Actinomycetospora atypica]|uniref:MerR family transcriptional regulator n=1 Tax=Actinomycetospora atypica TaxID=1290095 RepID=A0ABV9YG02_9PSEU